MTKITAAKLAARIDHTLLKPEAQAEQVDEHCDQAVSMGCCSVCVSLFWLPRVAKRLAKSNTTTKIDIPIAYATGSIPTALKVGQARWALDNGADEIDMVANIGALRDEMSQLVQDDIAAVADAVHSSSKEKILTRISQVTGDKRTGF